ncbi:Serine protease AprX [archaeon HR04]|nr:Serine protease AprX [archaeon HR04]
MYNNDRRLLLASLSLLLILSTIVPKDSYQYQQYQQVLTTGNLSIEKGIHSYPDPDIHTQLMLSGLRSKSMLISLDGLRFEPAGVSRVIIIGKGDLEQSIAGRVFNYVKVGDGSYIASATISDDAIPFLQAKGLRVMKDFMVTLDAPYVFTSSLTEAGQLQEQELEQELEQRQGADADAGADDKGKKNDGADADGSGGADASRFSIIYALDEIHAKGVSGKGVRVAIVDSGVDFSSKDMSDALARDEDNMPIMLDADAQGIVLTSARFIAKIVDGMIVNAPLPDEFKDDQSVSNVYVDDTGVYLNIKNREKGMKFEIYNTIYPYISPLKFTATSSMDWKIGNSATDFIKSKSGVYRMGFFLQLNFHLGRASLMIVPILLVDSKEAGVYDTVYADMSTAWADFALFELRKKPEEVKFDFDFTDERAIRIGEGNEMLIYDADNDGNADLSAGMLGAYVLDVWGVIREEEGKGKDDEARESKDSGSNSKNEEDDGRSKGSYIDDYLGAVNGRLLEPIDKDGRYITVMFDFFGHGTQSAGTIVAKGMVDYPVYESQQKRIKGIAPDAKIVPVKALWFGDVAYAWLWASGFDQVREEVKGEDDVANNVRNTTTSSPSLHSPLPSSSTTATPTNTGYNTDSSSSSKDNASSVNWRWIYTGKHRADVINNSWGIPSMPILDHGAGYDAISMLATVLSIPASLDPEYPGVLMVNSAGNSGHAYGTVSAPATSPLALTVGATTNNVIVGLEFTKKQPRFGNSIEYYDDIADFSSKGPSIIGDVKPELVATGAYGFAPLPVNSKHAMADNSTEAFGVFGGTSMAAPIVSGSAALLIQMLKEKGIGYDPSLVKAILISTASDLKHDPFTQGSGRVDPLKAIEYVEGKQGSFIAYTDDTYRNYLDVLSNAVKRQNLMLEERSKDKGDGDGGEKYGFRLTMPDDVDVVASKWYAGYVPKGSSKHAEFTIVNNGEERLKVTIEPTMLRLISISSMDGRTSPREKDPSFNSEDYGYIPNYIRVGKNGSIAIVGGSDGSSSSSSYSSNSNSNSNGEGSSNSSDKAKSDADNKIKIGSFDLDVEKVKDADLMIAKIYYPFNSFMNLDDPLYANELRIASLYAYDWRDEDKNSSLTYKETAMINRAGAWGTTQHLVVREPFKRIDGDLLLGVYPVPNTISYWFGNTKKDAEPLDYKLIIAFYKKDAWDTVDIDGGIVMRDDKDDRTKNVLLIGPKSKATFRASINVPEDAREGVYQGFITVSSNVQITNIPVSFVVPIEIGSKDKDIPVVMGSRVDGDMEGDAGEGGGSNDGIISSSNNSNSSNSNGNGNGYASNNNNNSTSETSEQGSANTIDITEGYRSKGITLLYDNSVVAGAFDMLGRYNSGEWKYYHLNITDPSINVLSMNLTWKSKWSSVDVFVVDPEGRIIATNVPGGVFKAFINWPSNDWLGRTRASDGGGFYPSQNNGENSTVLYIPINSTGIYSIILHTTLFSAEHDVYEPLQIEVKPAALIPDTEPPRVKVDLPEYARGMIDVRIEVVDDNIEEVVYRIDDSPPLPLLTNKVSSTAVVVDGVGRVRGGMVVDIGSDTHNHYGIDNVDSKAEGRMRSSTISIDTSRLADGPHTITIAARDKVGHRLLTNVKFMVDNTPPTILIDGLSSNDGDGRAVKPVKGTLAFSVDARDANLKSLSIILPDGRVVDEHEISIDTTLLSDGMHEVRIVAEDMSGNVSEEVRRFMVDNTPPLVSILEEDGRTVSGIFELRYSVVEDNLKQLLIAIDGNARQVENTGSFIINTMDLIDGKHRVEVIAEDHAGHKSSAGIEFMAVNYEPIIKARVEDARITAQNTGLAIGLAIGAGVAAVASIAVMRYRSSKPG